MINGEEVSQYSRLASIVGENLYQYVSNVISYLDSEVFDDYEIDYYGYQFIYDLICEYVKQSEYCKSVHYYSMETIDTPENVMEMLFEIAEAHNVQVNQERDITVYKNLPEINVKDEEYIKITDALPSDIGIFENADRIVRKECKLCIVVGVKTTMNEENIITVSGENIDEVVEYYYIHNLYIPNFEEYITILKYQNLSERESVLLNAVQSNKASYYLGEIPKVFDLADELPIDFVSFPIETFRIEISDEKKLKPEENKWRAVAGGQVTVSVLDKDNQCCESHILNIVEHQYATGIKIIPRFDYLKVNERNYVDVIVEPANAEDKDELLYEVSDGNIVKYEDGQVIALKDGSTTLKVKGKQCQGTLKIDVKSSLSQVVLEQTNITMKGGTTAILQCRVLPQNAETEHIVWDLDNRNIAAINPSKDKMKCQVNTSERFTGKGNIRCYDQTTGIGAICNIEVVSKIKHTWVGTMALICMLVGFFLPVLSGVSIGFSVYGLVQDEETSHRARYIVCAVISVLTIFVWIGSQ